MGTDGDGRILSELKRHAPFTAAGAVTGIVVMVVLVVAKTPQNVSEGFFDVFHPLHVLLSAMVTASLYRRYRRNVPLLFVIGYLGSVGIATISDIILPYLGGRLLGAEMHFHLGFIDKWWLVNPLALAGISIAFWKPTTRVPHFGHVLLSTWASLFYLTAHGEANWLPLLPAIFLVLFVAVWFPCCLSDIIFPLLFVGKTSEGEHAHQH